VDVVGELDDELKVRRRLASGVRNASIRADCARESSARIRGGASVAER